MDLTRELEAVTVGVKQQAPAQVVTAIEADIARLAAEGIAQRALQPGQTIPSFELSDWNGRLMSSTALLARGPLVISFYRGEWCPYCSLELRAYQERLADIQATGASFIAISPQTVDHSLSTQQKNQLSFPVLSDPGNRVARQFGLVFRLNDNLASLQKNAWGLDLSEYNGDASNELPVPATYVVAKDGKVAYAYIDVDYRKRVSPEEVVARLNLLAQGTHRGADRMRTA